MMHVEPNAFERRLASDQWAGSVRPARLSDAADLHQNCFPEQSAEEVQEYLRWSLAQTRKGRMVRLVVEAGSQVVASGQLAILHLEGEIGSLVVAPGCREQGIGTALVLALLKVARQRALHTVEIMAHEDKPWIAAWYRRLGFSCEGRRTLPRDERVLVLRMSLQEQRTF